jgi:hypothetical protein
MNARPRGTAFYCELRPRGPVGSSFLIESRQRVLSWTSDGRPRTAFGTVNRRVFAPNPSDPTSGMAFVEHRTASGERRWWNPRFDDSLSDGNLKRVMLALIEEQRRATSRR